MTATTNQNTTDYVIGAFEASVRELAREHAPSASDSDYPVCSACVRITPLAMERALDVPKAQQFENRVSALEHVLATYGDGVDWVARDMAAEYEAEYYSACASPADCFICEEAGVDDEMDCGHDEIGEPCPHPDRVTVDSNTGTDADSDPATEGGDA